MRSNQTNREAQGARRCQAGFIWTVTSHRSYGNESGNKNLCEICFRNTEFTKRTISLTQKRDALDLRHFSFVLFEKSPGRVIRDNVTEL